MKDTVIVYHGNCPDGFGGAYSAWKKFGDSASYIPVYHGYPSPEGLTGKEIYIIDFSYPDGVLLEIEKNAKRLVVLDHHEGVQTLVEAVKEHVYDSNRSGTGIAWEYFHPGVPLPRLLAYIQDNDLWRHALPHYKEVGAYMSIVAFEFDVFEKIVLKAESEEGFKEIIEKGKAYAEYYDYMCKNYANQAEEVDFDGYKILAVTAPRIFRSEVGHILATRKPPFAIVWYPNAGKWHFSLRGDGSIDLTEVAKKHGGNGHPNAASFQLPLGSPLPFTSSK